MEEIKASQWAEEDLVPISALEHYSYCPRQCALIHREQTFDENLYTLRGRQVHERVELGEGETAGDVRVERSLPLWSARLGMVGKADVVEFHNGVPYPVEYKHGTQAARHAIFQLCAQALCLEEMTGRRVEKGAIYVHVLRRRREIVFTPELWAKTEAAIQEVRRVLNSDLLPPVVADARCPRCSLYHSCLPHILAARGRLQRLRSRLFAASQEVP